MNTRLLKTGIVIPLVLVLLTGCELFDKVVNYFNGEEKVERGDTETFDSTKPLAGIAPYYANGDIEYYQAPTPLDTNTMIGNKKDLIINAHTPAGFGSSPSDPTPSWAELSKLFHFYEVGTIKVPTYKDYKLVILNVDCEGPCYEPYLYRLAYNKTKNELILLSRHSNEYRDGLVAPLTSDEDTTIQYKGIEPPDQIKIPNSDKVLELESRYNSFLLEDLNTFQFSDQEVGNLYTRKDYNYGCFFLKSPDGSISLYGFNPHFFKSEPVTITWQDASPQTILSDTYKLIGGACGADPNCYIIENVNKDDLEIAGKTSTGVDLYIPKNPQESAYNPSNGTPISPQDNLSQAYVEYKSSYQFNEDAKKKPLMSFSEFAGIRPLLYWQDPLGRWTHLIRQDTAPQAECGKPVIYLYPEKEIDVNVKVGIDKLTKTVPEYEKDGWTVRAYPNGTLYNYTDSQTYPYLFWEGQSKDGISVDKGFLVERENLSEFLDSSLSELGLTKVEKQDFTDFWLQRMLDNKEPYFFVSFLGTKDFNKIAPLEITPVPNTLIRVFMYYMPTYEKISMPEEKLSSVKRNGFTVVEWGGTSTSPWQD